MENEEKAKVILDYDKYQELLAKANLNEKYIEDIKFELSKEYENKIRDFENQSHYRAVYDYIHLHHNGDDWAGSMFSRVIKILNEVNN